MVDAVARIGGGIIAHSAYPRRVESVSGLADLDAEPVVRGQCDGRWAALWLALIEDRMSSRFFRDPQDAPPNLNIRHPRDVRNEIRMTAFAFAHLNPTAAQGYLSGLNQDEVTYNDKQDILRAPGTLARAAPAALVDFRKTRTPCMQTGAPDTDRLAYMTISSRQRHRAKVHSSTCLRMRLPRGCV